MRRYFVFLFVEDAQLSNILNTAILALNPSERWPAHVTLAGPYSTLRSVPRKLDFERRLSVLGVNQFRSERQNTVYLTVGAAGMRAVWRKSDYPYNPHLTLFDGTDHDLGDEAYFRLKQLRPIFKFEVTKLQVVESGSQRDFTLLSELDLSFSPKLMGLRAADFRNLAPDDRIEIAVEAVRKAVEYSNDPKSFKRNLLQLRDDNT